MKKFFKVLIAISVITLLSMFSLDTIYSYAFKNGLPRSKIQNMLQLNNKHYDVAFFGSSRIEQHIDCKLITELTGKSCINFGISGGSPGDMLILMKLSEERNISFDEVFMQVDYNFVNSGITALFKANLVPFIKEPSIMKQLRSYREEFFYRSMPFYRFMIYDKVVGLREATASSLKLKHNINIEIGFTPRHGKGKAIAGSFPEIMKDKSPELKHMQELYKNTNTRLEFFTAPYCQEVKNRDFMDKVQSKLPGLHNYIAFFDDKEEYFFDCGHLNDTGAEVFTKILVKDLLQ